MAIDADLFTLPFVDDALGCSRDGAERAFPKAGTQRALVYEAIAAHGPISDHDLAARLGFALSVVCARRHALVKDGFVTDAGCQVGPCGVRNTRWTVAR